MSIWVNNISDNFASVGIIGCGWLGKALATSLLAKGVSILATSSQLRHVESLCAQGIKAQQLVLPAPVEQLIDQDIFTQSCLVIAIPPQFKQGRSDYADKIAGLVNAAQQRGLVQRIILLSSTAVYQGLAGNVDEQSALDFSREKVQVLHRAEQYVLHFANQSNVLRLAGLVGPERHPGKFILANKAISNSLAAVNLIHQQDAVGLIESLSQINSPQGIFNGVSDTHVSKKEYYQCAAKSLKLAAPLFANTNINETIRVVSGEKAKKALNYAFTYPDLLAWL